MSYHSHLAWKLEDGYSADVVCEMVKGVQWNREYAIANGDGDTYDICYSTLCPTDWCICLMDMLCMKARAEQITPESFNAWAQKLPEPVRQMLREALVRQAETDNLLKVSAELLN